MLLIFLLALSVLEVGVFLLVVEGGDQENVIPLIIYFFATVEGFVWAVCSDCNTELFPGRAVRVSKWYREELMVRIGVF